MRFRQNVVGAPRDVKLLWASVFLRLLSYGITNQVLTLLLSGIHMGEDRIGLFMSLTLVGDVLCSYILTWYADSWGRRRVLIYGSIMMMLSGIVFSYSENFHVLLIFAIFGVISPSSDEVGPFKSIEESMIAHLSSNDKRPDVYAMHSLVGTVGSALGAISCGVFIKFIKSHGYATTDVESYKLVFRLYAFIAFMKVIIMLMLSEKTELDSHFHDHIEDNNLSEAIVHDELTPLVETAAHKNESNKSRALSKETKATLTKLLVIFMVDSLGSGFMTSGWMVYYYKNIFLLSPVALGTMFFVSQGVQALSTLPSSSITRKLGPVKTTLAVQIPSGIFSILIPFAVNYLPLSIFLLNLHFATMAMDVTPRQIILTNLFKSSELTRVMGIVNIGKTFARCIGPIFTGLLASKGLLWCCYIISGSLVITADAILAFWFLSIDHKIKAQCS